MSVQNWIDFFLTNGWVEYTLTEAEQLAHQMVYPEILV